jgi:CheY-like chemotaxis protein
MSDNSQKILVVDDIEDWRVTIKGMLEDADYEVEVAASSEEALDKLERHIFDLAILDMRLDETDEDNREGLRIIAKVIKDKYSNTKTIILTGYADQDSVQAMQPAVDGIPLISLHLEKTETENLVGEVKRLLAS